MAKPRIIILPKEHLPDIEQLQGSVRNMAEQINLFLPGEGVYHALILAQIFGKRGYFFAAGIDPIQKRIRNDRICDEFDQGMTVNELSAKYRLGERQIRAILKGQA